MSLTKCIECGKEISDKAKMCVHCGCPISRINKYVKIKMPLYSSIALIKNKKIRYFR